MLYVWLHAGEKVVHQDVASDAGVSQRIDIPPSVGVYWHGSKIHIAHFVVDFGANRAFLAIRY